MRQLTIAGFKPAFTLFAILSCFILQAQSSKIDWSRDTVSKSDAIGGKDTYVNTIRGSGQLATEKITLPVDKMKEILDACTAKGVTEITVLFVAIRQSDIARFRKNNPEIAATNSQLKGRQLIVFRIPRHVFSYPAGAKAGIPQDNPLLLSLLSVGLMQLDQSYIEAPAAGDDIYFSIGTICPPPASCDL